MRAAYDVFTLQYHPRSWAEADGKARAAQKENTTTGERSFSELRYYLPDRHNGHESSKLHHVWQQIQARLVEEATEWHEAQLITISYNCKS